MLDRGSFFNSVLCLKWLFTIIWSTLARNLVYECSKWINLIWLNLIRPKCMVWYTIWCKIVGDSIKQAFFKWQEICKKLNFTLQSHWTQCVSATELRVHMLSGHFWKSQHISVQVVFKSAIEDIRNILMLSSAQIGHASAHFGRPPPLPPMSMI